MTRAEVKLSVTPSDFALIVRSLNESLETAREEVKDHEVDAGSEEWQAMHQDVLHLEALLRMLK